MLVEINPMNTVASLFNLAGPDLLVILVIVLLLFGAKKLPELARGMGQAMKEFNKAKDEFESELTKPNQSVAVKPAETIEHKTGTPLTASEPVSSTNSPS